MDTWMEMIDNQLLGRDIKDPLVIDAMCKVDRRNFLPRELWDMAYEDGPLPIGKGQTMSQPYIVAYMIQALGIGPNDRVLEIGTGCGYNAAVLAQIAYQVYSVEIIPWLSVVAEKNLKKLNLPNLFLKCGDGHKGWPEHAPYDAIIITAAPTAIPGQLKNQMKLGGRLLAPVGAGPQKLSLLTKTGPSTFTKEDLLMVSFVPMTGGENG